MMANNQLKETRLYYKKQATLLAVSGMQAYIQNPNTLLDEHYGSSELTLPDGTKLDYYQYATQNGTNLSKTKLEALLTPSEDPDKEEEPITYKVVIAAIAADTNHNQKQDSGEKFFFKKELVYDGNGNGNEENPEPPEEPIEQTEIPIITHLNIQAHTLTGIAEKNATISLNEQDVAIANLPLDNECYISQMYAEYKDKTKSYGCFEIDISTLLNDNRNDYDYLIAHLKPQKKPSEGVPFVINIKNDDNFENGLVKIIKNENGQEVSYYEGISNYISRTNTIVVLSGANLDTNEDVTITSTKKVIIENNVNLSSTGNDGTVTIKGDEGVTIYSDVTVEQTSNGHGNMIIQSDKDITINATLRVNSNSSNNNNNNDSEPDILIESSDGKVVLDDSELHAVNNITIKSALGISIENLFVSINTTATTSGNICGELREDSSTVNGGRNFICASQQAL